MWALAFTLKMLLITALTCRALGELGCTFLPEPYYSRMIARQAHSVVRLNDGTWSSRFGSFIMVILYVYALILIVRGING